jgi:phosphohistidine phosphatase
MNAPTGHGNDQAFMLPFNLTPMTTIVIVRHGEAEPEAPGVEDDKRALVKKGQKQMRRVASFLEEMGLEPDVVLSSPMLRAVQSAETILDEMGLEELKVETLDELLPNSDPSPLVAKLKEHQGVALVVGHMPSLSALVKALTGSEVDVKKGGVVVVEHDPLENRTSLELLLNQKVLKLI